MRLWLLLFALVGGTAMANTPDSSKRPVLRSDATPALESTGAITPAPRSPEGQAAARRGALLAISLRPKERTRAVKRAIRRDQKLRAKGAICKNPDIQGAVVGRVPGRMRGCGVADAVRVRAVSGVSLTQQSVMDCSTAHALKHWVDNSVKPALQKTGGGVVGLRVAAHYICRTRNNKPGGKISEHGKGRAIDISGFILRDGTEISVLKGWTSRENGQALRQMHSDACGTFGTVLGPNADSFHRDHFHFDTARYRSGTYCR